MKVKIGLKSQSIPDGEYHVMVKKIVETKVFKRRTLEFHFEVVEGPHKDIQCRGFVNMEYETISAHTKLYKWISIATNAELDAGEDCDLENTFGDKVFLARIESRTSKKTKNAFSNVTELKKVVHEL